METESKIVLMLVQTYLAALNGCPDTDGDGLLMNDACPDVFGLAALKGPDTDKDGEADKINVLLLQDQKKMQVVLGLILTRRVDKDDKCPEVKGTVANNGCPDASEAVMMKLNDMVALSCLTQKASLKKKPIQL
jgi:hypothetical protein